VHHDIYYVLLIESICGGEINAVPLTSTTEGKVTTRSVEPTTTTEAHSSGILMTPTMYMIVMVSLILLFAI